MTSFQNLFLEFKGNSPHDFKKNLIKFIYLEKIAKYDNQRNVV